LGFLWTIANNGIKRNIEEINIDNHRDIIDIIYPLQDYLPSIRSIGAPPSGTSNDRTAVLRALGPGRPALRGVGASTSDEFGRGGGFPRKTAISWSMRCCESSLDFFHGTFFVVSRASGVF
jgi:hypothetical protein